MSSPARVPPGDGQMESSPAKQIPRLVFLIDMADDTILVPDRIFAIFLLSAFVQAGHSMIVEGV